MNKDYTLKVEKVIFRGKDYVFKCYLCEKVLKPGDEFHSIMRVTPFVIAWVCSSIKCRDMCVLQNI